MKKVLDYRPRESYAWLMGGSGVPTAASFTHKGKGRMMAPEKRKESDGGRGQKYGAKNLHMTLEGGEILIRIDPKAISHDGAGNPCLTGSPNPTEDNPEKVRKVDLVATSAGFTGLGDCKISVNVTRG